MSDARPFAVRQIIIALLAGTALAPCTAFGQSAAPGTVITLDPVVVEGETPTAMELADERLQATPGGTSLLDLDALPEQANVRLSDVLRQAPGVVIQDFFGGFDQPRLQIRGSGLQQNPVERGILFLQDGLPVNRADGSYAIGFADPNQAEFIEINRGYTANRLGATVLGGAMNFVSPTGSSSPGATAAFEGGSYGYVSGTASAGFAADTYDAYVLLDGAHRDGYRVYNESDRATFTGNVGLELTDAISARVFAGYALTQFDVAGPLTADQLDADPQSVHTGPTIVAGTATNPGPNVVRDQPNRDAEQFRLGTRVTGDFGDHVVDGAIGYTYTDDTFTFPIPGGIRETDGSDLTFSARYAYRPDRSQVLPLFEATLLFSTGWADRNYYLNESGEQGDLFGSNDLSANTLSFHAGANIPLGSGFVLSPAVAYSLATRTNDDTYGAATRPTIAYNPGNPTTRLPDGSVTATDTSYDHTYHGFSPSLALSWQPVEEHMLFAAVSRSFEPPTHDDLLATINGTPNSSPGRPMPGNPAFPADAFATPDLDAQTGTTAEVGWRGTVYTVDVDAVVYYSWIENELLNLRDATGVSLGAINADQTRHFGIELGASAEITEGLVGRIGYTFQDFRFHDDPLRGNNRLAGAPPHLLSFDLDYAVTEDLSIGGTVQWRPAETPVDNYNTLTNDPFATLDLRASYQITPWAGAYVEMRNVTDETYASSTLITDQARADQAAYLPGEGRAVYGGLRVAF
ncbi:MAG: TonB-dependent receptor [Rhodospirillaceae bacterium]|nr:TonB-dependent receptor [Rhodospirillaceae bacterium]